MNIVISSGHGKFIRGASGFLDEVDEARKVINKVAEIWGDGAIVFHDDVSTSQNENLDRIVDFHNSKEREVDVSVHFNAYNTTDSPMGCEVLFLTQGALAKSLSAKISAVSGLKDRGAKKREDLFFLNKTDMPAILIEICFVDSKTDTMIYDSRFDAICGVIVAEITAQHPKGREELLTIPPVIIKQEGGGSYVRFISDLDVCNDGSGPSHGDPHHQSQTAYYNGGKYLNADEDKYIVIPPQIRSMVPGVVMGCKGRATNLKTGEWHSGVIGEIGPDDKTGETAYCLAKVLNPQVEYNSGDTELIYLYELWPDVPAVVDGKTYKLEAA